ncbi:MAG: alpha/beta fold hydrolase, partial [Bacteroidota bacterium]
LAWNCRSCSGEMNRAFRMYNHGEVGDIGEVLRHAMRTKDYERVVMVGFSMGGNITMKYLGVNAGHLDAPIYKAVAFSAPCDLGEGAELLDWPENKFYRNRFFKMLRKKITEKAEQYPGRLDITKFDEVKVWKDFDNFFSAPINGYKDADDFYRQGSAINFMGPINVPVLLVNALNDPILSPNCYPKEFCEQHAFIYLETPQHGGHVGFSGTKDGFNWAERRAWTFVTEH